MRHFLFIGLIGFLTAFAGFFPAGIFSAAARKRGKRPLGAMLGFTAGLLIAFICFEILPDSLERWGLYKGIFAMLAGVVLSAWLEGGMGDMGRLEKAGALLSLGVMIHNIPEGMALGSVLNISLAAGISLSAMIAIHCFPEALAIMLPLRQAGASNGRIFLLSAAMAVPMALGAFFGGIASTLSPMFVDACLCFSGGVMLYISCGEILPESKDVWRGRLSAVGAMVGFAGGVWLTAKL
ncbi:MAG: ZIP family metal transporter [Clostridiales bacterium]|jgi:ZIP family zinc transporter|nr:ZIP family metal transporter [Clostridiales bacterium]